MASQLPLRNSPDFQYGDLIVAEVATLDELLAESDISPKEFDTFVKEWREARAREKAEHEARLKAEHEARLEVERQAEIARLAAEKHAAHEAALKAKFLAEADKEIRAAEAAAKKEQG